MSNLFEQIKNLVSPVAETQASRLKILFRPDRWKYVKKNEPKTGCVFCEASRKEMSFETLVVYKSQYSMILLNKFPYNSGHLLVTPLRHEGDFLNLTQAEHEDIHQCLRVAVGALREIYTPHGMNIGLNLDKAAGAGIPEHMHYHVIPRFMGDMNFFPVIAETKVIPESLDAAYAKIKNFFETYKG